MEIHSTSSYLASKVCKVGLHIENTSKGKFKQSKTFPVSLGRKQIATGELDVPHPDPPKNVILGWRSFAVCVLLYVCRPMNSKIQVSKNAAHYVCNGGGLEAFHSTCSTLTLIKLIEKQWITSLFMALRVGRRRPTFNCWTILFIYFFLFWQPSSQDFNFCPLLLAKSGGCLSIHPIRSEPNPYELAVAPRPSARWLPPNGENPSF